ncbi:viral A-type inclusion protein [Reticulomyxa filosa]|uniref:Viral A-type inclusion protein n=1 Tax=Reticulomyxa filosa TaxID=46433 RepID=X6N8L9_RETFI|nr:viral A-type inclusion protein [Reticulomyxa filosa]|eukprot:ETO21657.1 viral A-type inclusion protein [Reticulomyxa filosa]
MHMIFLKQQNIKQDNPQSTIFHIIAHQKFKFFVNFANIYSISTVSKKYLHIIGIITNNGDEFLVFLIYLSQNLFSSDKHNENDAEVKHPELMVDDVGAQVDDLKQINDRFKCIMEHNFGRDDTSQLLQNRLDEEQRNHQEEIDQLKKAFQQKETVHLTENANLKQQISDLKKLFFLVKLNFKQNKNWFGMIDLQAKELNEQKEQSEFQNDKIRDQLKETEQQLDLVQRDADKVKKKANFAWVAEKIRWRELFVNEKQCIGQLETEQIALKKQLKALQDENDALLQRHFTSPDKETAQHLLKEQFSEELAKIHQETKEQYDDLRQQHAAKLENECKEKLKKVENKMSELADRLAEKEKEYLELNTEKDKLANERLKYLTEMVDAKKEKDDIMRLMTQEMDKKSKQIDELQNEVKKLNDLNNRVTAYCDHLEDRNLPLHDEIKVKTFFACMFIYILFDIEYFKLGMICQYLEDLAESDDLTIPPTKRRRLEQKTTDGDMFRTPRVPLKPTPM